MPRRKYVLAPFSRGILVLNREHMFCSGEKKNYLFEKRIKIIAPRKIFGYNIF
jgi:hypothetical protein